jgi:hypothetical protein
MRPNIKKKEMMEVSLEIVDGQEINISVNQGIPAASNKKKEVKGKVRTFHVRDLLSARIDETDPRVLHLWSFKQHP